MKRYLSIASDYTSLTKGRALLPLTSVVTLVTRLAQELAGSFFAMRLRRF